MYNACIYIYFFAVTNLLFSGRNFHDNFIREFQDSFQERR